MSGRTTASFERGDIQDVWMDTDGDGLEIGLDCILLHFDDQRDAIELARLILQRLGKDSPARPEFKPPIDVAIQSIPHQPGEVLILHVDALDPAVIKEANDAAKPKLDSFGHGGKSLMVTLPQGWQPRNLSVEDMAKYGWYRKDNEQ